MAKENETSGPPHDHNEGENEETVERPPLDKTKYDDEGFIDTGAEGVQVYDDDDGAPPPGDSDEEEGSAAAGSNAAGEQEEEEEAQSGPDPLVEYRNQLAEVQKKVVTEDNAEAVFVPSKAVPAVIQSKVEDKPLHSLDIFEGMLVCGGEDDFAYLVEYNSAKKALELAAVVAGHSDTVVRVAFNPGGTVLATASLDGTIKLWDVAKLKAAGPEATAAESNVGLVAELSGLTAEAETILWHPSGKVIVGCGADGMSVMWNAEKGTYLTQFACHNDAVTVALWSADVKNLITGSADGTVAVSAPKTGEVVGVFKQDLSPDNAGVTTITVHQQNLLLTGFEDGTICLLSLAKMKSLQKLDNSHEQSIESIAICPVFPLFVSSSCDCRVTVWNLNDYSVRHVLKLQDGITKSIWVRERLLLATTDGDVVVFDGRTSETEPQHTYYGHSATILGIQERTIAGSSKIFTCSDDGSVRCFALDVGSA